MYSSENMRVKFRIVRPMVSDAIDLFGSDVQFSNEDETGVTVTATANKLAVAQFAKNFCPDVVVPEPESPRAKIKEHLEKSLRTYR